MKKTNKTQFLSILLLLTICSISVLGKSKRKAFKPSFDYYAVVDFETTYNDNVSLYAQNNIDDFKSGENAYRYGIDTYDDLIVSPTFKLYLVQDFTKFYEARLRLRGTFNNFVKNSSVKNYQSYQAKLYNRFFKKYNFNLAYNYIPKFYVRDVWDNETRDAINPETGIRYLPEESYQEFVFEKQFYTAEIGAKLPYEFDASLKYVFTEYFYNEYFTEYDTKIDEFGFGIGYEFAKLDFGFDYSFSKSDDKGDSDSDASYDKDKFDFDVSYNLRKVPFLRKVSAAYELEKVYYQSDFPAFVDPLHAGRVDTVHRWKFGLDARLNKDVSLSFDYLFRKRKSKSESINSIRTEELAEVKNYKNHQISLTFSYRYN